MARRTIYPLIDRALDGTLADRLRRWRDEGMSYASIATRLHVEHGVDVSHETVRQWVLDLDDGEPAA